MPIAINEKEGYVIIPLLPLEQQIPFKKWISTQTVPIITSESIYQDSCAYLHDYQRWLSAWERGQVATILD